MNFLLMINNQMGRDFRCNLIKLFALKSLRDV